MYICVFLQSGLNIANEVLFPSLKPQKANAYSLRFSYGVSDQSRFALKRRLDREIENPV
jgi:hypothetical protein